VPDQRLELSLFRTPSPRTSKFHLAVTVPAVATMAAIAGTVGVWTAGTAAQPTAMAQPVSHVTAISPQSARPGSGDTVRSHAELDALLSVAAAPKGTVGTSGVVKVRKKRPSTPRQIARSMLRNFGWSKRQFPYLNSLWSHESGWNVHAQNRYSGAYGIPQAVPGAKMAAAGSHWRTSARTQIRWGLRYIKSRYGSPRGAWDHELATGWY
jgi:hypothetical protein